MANTAVQTTKDTSGRRTVSYRGLDGTRKDAVVLGPGTNSGVKLQLVEGRTRVIKDDVALATARNQTNVYFNQR